MSKTDYDAILVVSFGGPESSDDVMPFLRNVTRGRNVPDERLEKVAEQYSLFGGKSPINDNCRALISGLEEALTDADIDLPVYWGNRNWHPLLSDTVAEMASDGVEQAIAFVTSATSSYPSCRQYLEDIEAARVDVGPTAPRIHKLRQYYDHPGFIEPMIDRAREARLGMPDASRLVFTAHSIPTALAAASDYEIQLAEAARLIGDGVGHDEWDLVWQSRSGSPHVPWLEPDINDHLSDLAAKGVPGVVVVPVGFTSDHMEVIFDLDTQAAANAEQLGLQFARAGTVGVDPRFVSMIVELVEERRSGAPRRALGGLEVRPDFCPELCCPSDAERRPVHAPREHRE